MTLTTKFAVEGIAATIPLIFPVAAFSCTPAGRAPEEIDQTYGGVPPEAVRFWL
jgi:hypothetical protein